MSKNNNHNRQPESSPDWTQEYLATENTPDDGVPVLALTDRWQEAVFTKFWTRDVADWRTNPGGIGINPTHWMAMPPVPTE